MQMQRLFITIAVTFFSWKWTLLIYLLNCFSASRYILFFSSLKQLKIQIIYHKCSKFIAEENELLKYILNTSCKLIVCIWVHLIFQVLKVIKNSDCIFLKVYGMIGVSEFIWFKVELSHRHFMSHLLFCQ